MTVWIKQGVTGCLKREARRALGTIATYLSNLGHDTFITSIREGNHMPGSLHYDGQAFDFKHHSIATVESFKTILGPNYDIVDEKSHIHVEYDPKD